MKRLEFNNEIIDGQSTVADNLAKSNRNFMLLKEILGSGASSQDIQNMLEIISQTYVKTEDIVNNLSSSDTNKPVSALQAKNLKQDITNLTGQLQQLNQSVSSLTQSLNQNISNLTQQLNQNVSSLTQRLDNKAELKELPLLNGWEKESQAYYYKTIGNLVICSARIKKTVPAYTGEYVAQLPQGYRISHGGQWSGYATENAGSGASKCIGLFITTDGKIGIDTLGADNLKCLMFTISFMAVD